MIAIHLSRSIDVGNRTPGASRGLDAAFRFTGLSTHGIQRHVVLCQPEEGKRVEWRFTGEKWTTVQPGPARLDILAEYGAAKRLAAHSAPWTEMGDVIISCPGVHKDGSLGQLLVRRAVCRTLVNFGSLRALDLPMASFIGVGAVITPDDARVTMSGTMPLTDEDLAAIHWLAYLHRHWPTREEQIAAALWWEVDRQADIVRRTTGQVIEVARPGESAFASQAAARLRASDIGIKLPKAAPARQVHRWLLPAEEAIIPEIMSHGQ